MSEEKPTTPVQATPEAGKVETPATPTPEAAATVTAPEVGKETPIEPPAKAAAVVPEKYTLKLPDGSLIDQAHVDTVAAFAKEQGLSNEAAQKILERENAAVVGLVEAQKKGGAEWTRRVNDWEKQALADKEIGGSEENLKASAELGKRVITKYFPESFINVLNESGYGSHPDVLKGFAKLGRMMSEDQLIMPGATPSAKKSMEEVFYGEPKTT